MRDEFFQFRKMVKPRTAPVRRILVFFGGVDLENHTMSAINALARIGIGGLIVDVVIGESNPFREGVEMLCAQFGFKYHVQVRNMAELMATADLAIGAGGGALWERCALGLPALVRVTAENQRESIEALINAGALVPIPFGGDEVENITHALHETIRTPERLSKLSRCSSSIMKDWNGHAGVEALIGN